MSKHVKYWATLAIVAVVVVACGGGEEAAATRSIDEIHREEGVPVRVRTVEPAPFATYFSFTTTLSGAAESTATATLSDEVADVLYQVGDFVQQDTPVVLFPPDNPSLNYEQARVSFESARTSFLRISSLFEDDGVSQQTFDDARTQFELARANWESVQNVVRVRAPISGFVTRVNVFASDNVNPGDPLFTVSDLGELRATVWLTDRQVQAVAVGQAARAIWQDNVITGRVVQVDLAMDQDMRAFAVKLRFDNPDLVVQSGVTATVEIETYRNDSAVILNQREVIDSGNQTTVFVAREDAAVQTPVDIVQRQGLLVEIGAGLEVGDEVIISGIELVGDGTFIRVVGHDDLLSQR